MFFTNLLFSPSYSDPTFKSQDHPKASDFDDAYLGDDLKPAVLNFEDVSGENDLEEFVTNSITPPPLNLENAFSLTSPSLSLAVYDNFWTRWRIHQFNKECSAGADKTLGNTCFERLKMSRQDVSETKTLQIANQINSKASIYIFHEIFSKKKTPSKIQTFAEIIVNPECREEFLFSFSRLQDLSVGNLDKNLVNQTMAQFATGSWLVYYDIRIKQFILSIKDESSHIEHIALTSQDCLNNLEPIIGLRLEKSLQIKFEITT